jgi:acetyltransferase-like isoleucine patch superfamily enzyme
MNKNVIIHEHVKIGKNSIIEDFTILGKPSNGHDPNQQELLIGDFATLRSGTIIYSGNIIGNNFKTGDHARIRENNKIGNDVSIGACTVVECGCEIKDRARIHSNCFIPEYTSIAEDAWIGPNVTMTNVLHPPCPEFKKYAPIKGEKCCHGPIIKKRAVVGAGSVILPGIVIGEDALVGAGAVATCDIPNGCVALGNPAKIVKKIEDLNCPVGLYKTGEVYSWRKK